MQPETRIILEAAKDLLKNPDDSINQNDIHNWLKERGKGISNLEHHLYEMSHNHPKFFSSIEIGSEGQLPRKVIYKLDQSTQQSFDLQNPR